MIEAKAFAEVRNLPCGETPLADFAGGISESERNSVVKSQGSVQQRVREFWAEISGVGGNSWEFLSTPD
jgi:hypothetical protein